MQQVYFHSSPHVNKTQCGFTLIELSIVLVIIGFIVGGIVVGKDLINAAAMRALISQMEKYNIAVRAFLTKYNALPGDMTANQATMFGFAPRGTTDGQGNGDGILKGTGSGSGAPYGYGFCEGSGETALFWNDLTYANGMNINLIEGSFSQANATVNPTGITGAALNGYFPKGKIGAGNYVYVWSGGPTLYAGSTGDIGNNGINYFGLSAVTGLGTVPGYEYGLNSSPGLTVLQAFAIDNKIDDGLPQSGKVTALYLNFAFQYFSPVWAGTAGTGVPYITATAGSTTSCFDNSANNTGTPGVNGAAQHYSIEMNNGTNCALSFQFQ